MTILIIDDSKFLQRGIQKVLQQAGYQTILASDGDEAIKMANLEHPDMILLDIMLPRMPGTAVLKNLKSNAATSAIPVVVLTGLNTLDGPKLKSEGADGYVKKSELDLQSGGQALLRLVSQLAGKPGSAAAR